MKIKEFATLVFGLAPGCLSLYHLRLELEGSIQEHLGISCEIVAVCVYR